MSGCERPLEKTPREDEPLFVSLDIAGEEHHDRLLAPTGAFERAHDLALHVGRPIWHPGDELAAERYRIIEARARDCVGQQTEHLAGGPLPGIGRPAQQSSGSSVVALACRRATVYRTKQVRIGM